MAEPPLSAAAAAIVAVTSLHQIQNTVGVRAGEIVATHENWPCRKGCDECCRHLASAPRVSAEEWRSIAAALDALPADAAEGARRRMANSGGMAGPVVCPLLDTASGSCLIYEARPVACRAYGFYAERECVLGCSRIEAMSRQCPDVVWGNHAALEDRLRLLGPAAPLSDWLAAEACLAPQH